MPGNNNIFDQIAAALETTYGGNVAPDPFDSLLNKACSIWKEDDSVLDAYGAPIKTFVFLQDDVPCFVERTSGKELNTPPAATSETSYGVQTFRVFMRPISVDDPLIPLNNKHWLQIKNIGAAYLDPNDADSGAIMHNITDVDDVDQLGHHLEVSTTTILP